MQRGSEPDHYVLSAENRERLKLEVDVPEEKLAAFFDEIERAIGVYRALIKTRFTPPGIKTLLREVSKNAGAMLSVMYPADHSDPNVQIMNWLLAEQEAKREMNRTGAHFPFLETHFAKMQSRLRILLEEYRQIADDALKDPFLNKRNAPIRGEPRLFAFYVLRAFVKAIGHRPKHTRDSPAYNLLVLCFDIAGDPKVDPYDVFKDVIEHTVLEDD